MLQGDSLILNDIVDQKVKNMNTLNQQLANNALDKWDRLFLEAQLLMFNGCFYEASRKFEALITVDYKVDDCHQLCGLCDFMIDHFWHSYCHFTKSSFKLQEYMIECLFGMKKYDKAQELLSEIQHPTDRSFYLKSQCLYYQNKFYQSGVAIQQAIAMNPARLYLDFQEKIYISCIQLKFDTLNLDGQ